MVRRSPLVGQHLATISRDALQKHHQIIRRHVRSRQEGYALHRQGHLYYVGLASNLRSRLSHHLKDRHRHSWDRFSVYITIGDHHLKELESLILRIVQPKGNRVAGKFPKSEDIRRRFARDIRAFQRDELRAILGKSFEEEELPETREGRKPVLARYVKEAIHLRARHKGKLLRAHVRRDGQVRYAGKNYNSPSVAGAAAVKRKSCNGWKFWTYERAPGDWVALDLLRR